MRAPEFAAHVAVAQGGLQGGVPQGEGERAGGQRAHFEGD